MDISFHCSTTQNFRAGNQIRAFLYSDYSIEPHNHDFYEINIVLNGKGIHQIENTSFFVNMGDIFVIPPMVAHAYYNTSSLDVYHILIEKNFILNNRNEFKNFPGFLELIEIEPFLRQHCSNEMFLHLSPKQIQDLKIDLKFMEDNSIFDKEELIPLKYHTLWKILYWLSSLLSKQISNKETKRNNDIEIIKTLEYIHKNYGEKITVNSLCKMTFLSRSTFVRKFKTVCGCSPIKYLNKYRCERAMEMMKCSAYSKTEIAHIVGFYDLSHMKSSIKRL